MKKAINEAVTKATELLKKRETEEPGRTARDMQEALEVAGEYLADYKKRVEDHNHRAELLKGDGKSKYF